MEKSEKHRFSSKTKEISTEKGKRHSKMLTKPKKVDYENPKFKHNDAAISPCNSGPTILWKATWPNDNAI